MYKYLNLPKSRDQDQLECLFNAIGSFPNEIVISEQLYVFIFILLAPFTYMRTRFHEATRELSRTTQGVRKRSRRIKLSKEARIALRKQRKESAERYQNAMKDAWSKINETVGDLATAHHRPMQRVEADLHMGGQLIRRRHYKTNPWNAFLWHQSQDFENDARGKLVLPSLVAEYKEVYERLTDQERKEIICLYEENKSTLATAKRITLSSRVNDISATLALIETEVKTGHLSSCMIFISLDSFVAEQS